MCKCVWNVKNMCWVGLPNGSKSPRESGSTSVFSWVAWISNIHAKTHGFTCMNGSNLECIGVSVENFFIKKEKEKGIVQTFLVKLTL